MIVKALYSLFLSQRGMFREKMFFSGADTYFYYENFGSYDNLNIIVERIDGNFDI